MGRIFFLLKSNKVNTQSSKCHRKRDNRLLNKKTYSTQYATSFYLLCYSKMNCYEQRVIDYAL